MEVVSALLVFSNLLVKLGIKKKCRTLHKTYQTFDNALRGTQLHIPMGKSMRSNKMLMHTLDQHRTSRAVISAARRTEVAHGETTMSINGSLGELRMNGDTADAGTRITVLQVFVARAMNKNFLSHEH